MVRECNFRIVPVSSCQNCSIPQLQSESENPVQKYVSHCYSNEISRTQCILSVSEEWAVFLISHELLLNSRLTSELVSVID